MPSNSTRPFFLDANCQDWYDGYLRKREAKKNKASLSTIVSSDNLQRMTTKIRASDEGVTNVSDLQSGEGPVRGAQWAAGSPRQAEGGEKGAVQRDTDPSTLPPTAQQPNEIPMGMTSPMVMKYLPLGLDFRSPQQGAEMINKPDRLQCLKAMQLPHACYKFVNVPKRSSPHPQKAVGLTCFKSLSASQPNNRKRPHSQISLPNTESVTNHSTDARTDNISVKRQRFLKTADALQKSGLMKVTMQSASLLKQNVILQREIEQLKQDTAKFLQWVLSNPENQHLRGLKSQQLLGLVEKDRN